jgi:hypothetical protein
MGGELARSEASPRFAVWALRDPGTAAHPNVGLERIQIIKGFLEEGQVRYAIHDVAGSASNTPSVDESTCEPVGSGADELCTVWEDPSFVPGQSAFYYARVLERPTCRWQKYACNAAKVDCSAPLGVPSEYAGCCDAKYPALQQERAWSSPIFYRPG